MLYIENDLVVGQRTLVRDSASGKRHPPSRVILALRWANISSK
jgi:hypothetical protein